MQQEGEKASLGQVLYGKKSLKGGNVSYEATQNNTDKMLRANAIGLDAESASGAYSRLALIWSNFPPVVFIG